MLLLEIPETEFLNENTNEFFTVKKQTLKLEHSLISISKWESEYCKPFISDTPKTVEETLFYIKCMNTDSRVDPNVYLCITNEMIDKVNKYIDAPMTATEIFDIEPGRSRARKTITSEMIYYWMIAGNVPVEFEKWHLNRLITLIRIISIESDPNKKKMRGKDVLEYNHRLNEKRKAELHTRG